jgi:hypothetical protein
VYLAALPKIEAPALSPLRPGLLYWPPQLAASDLPAVSLMAPFTASHVRDPRSFSIWWGDALYDALNMCRLRLFRTVIKGSFLKLACRSIALTNQDRRKEQVTEEDPKRLRTAAPGRSNE